MHRDKIMRMGSSIDTRSPMPQPHLTLYGRDYVAKKRATTEAAFSDLKMIQSIAKTMTRQPSIPERKGPVSLNADSRKSEIFRIMKENHRLLDRLETLEPIVSTSDMLREYKSKSRYTILVSHSKRLAGEYDTEITRIRTEDKAKTDAMNRSVHLRLTKYRMDQAQNSMSMPSLTPLAATDPGGLSGAMASPAQAKPRAKPVVTRPLGSPGGLPAQASSSSKSVPPAAGYAAAAPAPAESMEAKRGVSFDGSAQRNLEAPGSDWQREGGPTPHPKKVNPDTYFEETPKSVPETPQSVQETPKADAPVPATAESPAAAEAPAASSPVPAPAEAAAPAQEFDPAQEKSPEPKVGVAGSSLPEAGAADGPAGDSYEDDFADQTQDSMSKAVDQSGTFEDSMS